MRASRACKTLTLCRITSSIANAERAIIVICTFAIVCADSIKSRSKCCGYLDEKLILRTTYSDLVYLSETYRKRLILVCHYQKLSFGKSYIDCSNLTNRGSGNMLDEWFCRHAQFSIFFHCSSAATLRAGLFDVSSFVGARHSTSFDEIYVCNILGHYLTDV